MQNKNKTKRLVSAEDKMMTILGYAFWSIVLIVLIVVYCYLYNPRKHMIEKRASKAFYELEQGTAAIYKERGYLFDENEAMYEFCNDLAKRVDVKNAQCFGGTDLSYNFTLNKTKVEVYGLNRMSKKEGSTFTKEFIIDVDGKKGENTIGIDRFPLKIYSTGPMAGKIAPVNCNFNDTRDYAFEFSSLCGEVKENDFLATNEPFGFNVIQIGGDDGKSRQILHNVPFLRADCAATAGEYVAMDYCDEKQIYWLSQCYDEYPCAVEIEVNK